MFFVRRLLVVFARAYEEPSSASVSLDLRRRGEADAATARDMTSRSAAGGRGGRGTDGRS